MILFNSKDTPMASREPI